MVVSIIALILAVLRIVGFKSIFFQGIAHIFVGGLGGAWLVGRKPLYLVLFLSLTVIEVLCAIFLR